MRARAALTPPWLCKLGALMSGTERSPQVTSHEQGWVLSPGRQPRQAALPAGSPAWLAACRSCRITPNSTAWGSAREGLFDKQRTKFCCRAANGWLAAGAGEHAPLQNGRDGGHGSHSTGVTSGPGVPAPAGCRARADAPQCRPPACMQWDADVGRAEATDSSVVVGGGRSGIGRRQTPAGTACGSLTCTPPPCCDAVNPMSSLLACRSACVACHPAPEGSAQTLFGIPVESVGDGNA